MSVGGDGALRARDRVRSTVSATSNPGDRFAAAPGQRPQPGQHPQQTNPRPPGIAVTSVHALPVGIVTVLAAKDAVHSHVSLPPALAPHCCRCYNKSIPSVTYAEGAEHTSKERTWEVVRDAHAYRPVP